MWSVDQTDNQKQSPVGCYAFSHMWMFLAVTYSPDLEDSNSIPTHWNATCFLHQMGQDRKRLGLANLAQFTFLSVSQLMQSWDPMMRNDFADWPKQFP